MATAFGYNRVSNRTSIYEEYPESAGNNLQEYTTLTERPKKLYNEPHRYINLEDVSPELNLLLKALEIKTWEKIYFTKATKIQGLHIDDSQKEVIVSDIPKIMLNDLNLLKYESRTLPCSIQQIFSRNLDNNLSDSETNYFEYMLEDKETNSASVHPMDIFLLIFFSCDKLYRQNFVVKIAKCQLSLPLVALDPFSQKLTIYSFSFQKLFKECYMGQDGKSEFPVVDKVMNTVSAFRIGNEGMERSKSKILNDLLNVSHDYFFHRSSEGSIQTNYLLNKTIEIGWYLPSGKKDSFEEPIALLNLRGDATNLQKQIAFLLSVSSVILIFISPQHFNKNNIQVLENMYESSSSPNHIPHLILVVESLGKGYDLRKLKNFKPDQYNLIKLCKNEAEDKSKLISGIKYGLKRSNKKICINDYIRCAQKMEILSEELNEPEIRRNSAEVQAILDRELPNDRSSVDLSMVKDKMLPLQGESWKIIAESYRNFYRKTVDSQHDVQEKNRELEKIRKDQLNIILTNPRNSMQHILFNAMDCRNTNVFWRIFQNELDKLSKKHIPGLYELYKNERDLLFEENRNNPRLKQNNLNNNLEEISQKISRSSFGIEHIFRELSQIYEVCMIHRELHFNKITNILQIDPNDLILMASELLLSGFQLEILDGDVSHIPIKWVHDILIQVSLRIGSSKRFYVISVLGLQSSGKSTLLNTMFGLEFAVSAGKCTKGAFMHLIHIEEDVVKQLGYEYILIIDTEGLRAPELTAHESYLHDNEIATFAIGLADLTIINILGEHSTEMQDILQITIYALIRMRKANFKPKCVFVHQNASAINMENKLAVITRKFVELLDEITLSAAKKERVADLFKNFNSVIEFNPQKDIFYFPTLFKGDPPMAPINPGYCEATEKLRRFILTTSSQFPEAFQTLQEIALKVGDLWSSVLMEDFVFNYRNVQELSALYELDSAQTQWTALFTQKLSEWVNEKAKMIKCKEGDDLDTFWIELNPELREFADNSCLKEQEEIKAVFFRNHHRKDFLVPRESISDIFFKSLREKEFNYSLSSLTEIFNSHKNMREIQNMFNNAETNLYQNIEEELKNRKGRFANLTRFEISQIFDGKWKALTEDIPNQKIFERIDIRSELRKLLIDSPLLHDVKLADKEYMINNFSEHIEFCSCSPFSVDKYSRVSKRSIYTAKMNTRPAPSSNIVDNKERLIKIKLESIVEDVMRECDELVSNTCDSNVYFSISYFEWLIGIVKRKCESESESSDYDVPNQFINDLMFYVCCREVYHFERLQEDYIQNVSVYAMLESKKDRYRDDFINKWKGIADEIILAHELSTVLLTEITNIANEKMKKQMLDLFLKQNQNFSTKFQLQMAVLTDLCQEENYQEYVMYIKNPVDYIEFWLLDKIRKFYYDKNNIETVISTFKLHQEGLIRLCTHSAISAKESIMAEMRVRTLDFSKLTTLNEKRNIQEFWKALFMANIDKKIPFNAGDELNFFDAHTISDFERFINAFQDSLGNFQIDGEPLRFCIETRNEIVRSFIHCKSCCRFCNELCILNTGTHKHSCGAFHRPLCLRSEKIRDYQRRDFTTSLIIRENPFRDNNIVEKKAPLEYYPEDDLSLPKYKDCVDPDQANEIKPSLSDPVPSLSNPVEGDPENDTPDDNSDEDSLGSNLSGDASHLDSNLGNQVSTIKYDYHDCSTKVLKEEKFQIKEGHFVDKYSEVVTDWVIKEEDAKNSIYWKWVIVKFHRELFGERIKLPEDQLLDWKSITKAQVLGQLEDQMKRCTTSILLNAVRETDTQPDPRGNGFMQALLKIFPFMRRFFS